MANSTSSAADKGVVKRVELARRQLQRASAVLTCLAVAIEYEAEADYADAATAARDMIDAAIARLDVLELHTE